MLSLQPNTSPRLLDPAGAALRTPSVLEKTLKSQILEIYSHSTDISVELTELFHTDQKAFVVALREIAKMTSDETEEAGAGAGVGVGEGAEAGITVESKKGASQGAETKNYAEIADEIAGSIKASFYTEKHVESLTFKDLEKLVFTQLAKTKIQDSQRETEAFRAQTEAMWNKNAKNVFTSPFNLFRTVVAVGTMACNFFASIGYAIGSISCFADAEVKALRRETAKDYLSHMDHDALNALFGLVQAIPLFGSFVTNMFSNRRYAYKTEIADNRKTQNETWIEFKDRLAIRKKEKHTTTLNLVRQESSVESDLDANSEDRLEDGSQVDGESQ